MSVSTDGIIAYGVLCGEQGDDNLFPWEEDEFEGDIEAWWRAVNDYKPIYKPYNDCGGYAEGWGEDDPRFGEYFKHQREWVEKNPLPVKLVNYCSGDYPMYCLAIPGTILTCNRGYPLRLEFSDLMKKPSMKEINTLLEFCGAYNIKICEQADWYLMSYYG